MNLIALLTILCFSCFSKEPETLRLGTFLIPDYVESREKGEFIELTHRIAQAIGRKIEIVVLPPKRTLLQFRKGQIIGYFPGLDVLPQGKISKSDSYYFKKDFIFTLKNVGKEEKVKKRLCLTSGYPYYLAMLKEKYDLITTSSDEACLQILKKKRVDYFLGELHTGVMAMRELNLKDIEIQEKPISTLAAYYAFHDDKEGRLLSKLFSKEIKRMKESGELSALFKETTDIVMKHIGFSYDPTNP